MKTLRLLAFSSMAALVAACSGGGTQSLPSTPNTQARPIAPTSGVTIQSRTMSVDGMTVRVLPARGVTVASDQKASARRAMDDGAGNLFYNGGPVQVNPKTYIVYWGSGWSTSDPEYTILNGFVNAMGGSGWLNTETQYYQMSNGQQQNIANPSGQLTGTWMDRSPIPLHPTATQIGAEAQRAALHFGYGGANANYIVALQHGHDSFGFGTQWCAWHSDEAEAEGLVTFTNAPYMSDAGYNCGAYSVNDTAAGLYDSVTIAIGHEIAETQTDPQPSSGWVDAYGEEIGDKCAWTDLENNPAAGGYPTQPLWDNAISGCSQSGP